MVDQEIFNDPKRFPRREDLVSITMLQDTTLEVRILRSDSKMHYHGMITCPPNTLLHSWLLEITGPIIPGAMQLCLADGLKEGEYDENAANEF